MLTEKDVQINQVKVIVALVAHIKAFAVKIQKNGEVALCDI